MNQPVRVLRVSAILAIAVGGSATAAMYDGTYHGTLTGGAGNATTCAKQAPVQITVANNRLEYTQLGHVTFSVPVGTDGSFSGSAQNPYAGNRTGLLVTTLDGKIAGGGIQADSKVGNYCSYKLELKRFN
jgi:hypothetical protein